VALELLLLTRRSARGPSSRPRSRSSPRRRAVRRRCALPRLLAGLGEPRLAEHIDLPFHNDAHVGVVEHVFHADVAPTLEEFRAELYSSAFDYRRLELA
jgi:hypothetical protein